MMILKKLGSILFLMLLSISSNVRADVLILVHGYQGSVFSWENSGVSPVLQQFGWKRAGILVGAPQGLVPLPTKWQDAENKVINLQLNSEAPLSGQANVFTTALRWVNDRYPSEKIIIAGHSLGGVVARLSMVRSGAPNVKALITIASPHLGTVLAYRGLDEIDDPFPINKIKEFFAGNDYDMLLRSRGLLHDIVPAVPGKLLHWLNTRQHPPIKYYSIVRSSVNGVLGDPIVPGFSQDMGNVQAIGKNSTRTIQGFSHNLSVLDGYALVNILEQL
ncbi:MAG: alpha/beta hydrolase [Gammaproteobacteria bacterium]|jgi:pimeloyl-ACP methyl ester carboxylesterase|nr:alpha/beta hydrolase [Gammaproteobacteria bacterium]MBT4450982.1 alpha/beta hydrolase [Gammaproteobacteria bacterium]MBT4861751.1 alpha/beta hydrolase [Gammaproteobacteria bacterium]MBT6700423.1 alpha/beta hydrolase [Gammaproteobacteria bacterium]